jgi:hypothetical protein
MNPLMLLNVRLYCLLARLYPDEIRRRWEPEMADTFALQLVEALRKKQWTAVIAIWYYAVAELFLIAVPLRITQAALLVPLTALVSAGAMFYGLFWVLLNSLTLRTLYHHTIARLGG